MGDIPRAVHIAFDIQKLSLAALGLSAAFGTYGAFHWLGALTGERAAHRAFATLGAILATCLLVLTSGLVARMATAQLLEGRRLGAGELREFARERWSTLLGIPLAFGGIALLMLALQAVLALIGSIPGVGPIVWSASFLMAFFLSLTAVITAAVHTIGAFLYPTIVAIRGVGAIGAMLEVVELARRKPLHLLLYEAVLGAVGAVMTFIIGALVWASLNVTTWMGAAIMGDKYDQIVAAVPSFFRVFLKPFRRLLELSPEPMETYWHYDLSGALMGASLLVVVVLTVTYPFVFFTSAGSLTYLILRAEPPAAERSPIEDL